MKICIVGVGAIGGWMGVLLGQSSEVELSAIARGATLAALRTHGWRLQSAEGLLQAPAHATDRPADRKNMRLKILEYGMSLLEQAGEKA